MSRPLRVFLTGLLAILPLTLTIAVTAWLVSLARDYIGPYSEFGQLLVSIGAGTGLTTAAPYILGLTIVILAIYFIGLIVETRIGPWFNAALDGVFRRIPIVSNLYDLSKRVVELVDVKDNQGIKAMTPVWCFFGGRSSAATLALMPKADPISIGDKRYLGVLVPTAPVPVGGCLVYVPEEWVERAEGGIEQLMSVYVSMGVTQPKSLPPKGP